VDRIDEKVNVAVKGSLITVDIFLCMDLDVSNFLESAQVQMLNIELVDLIEIGRAHV
jgi:hypothetical protein